MTSIKVKFRPSAAAEHEGIVYYQIIHSRKCCMLNSGIKMPVYAWQSRGVDYSSAPIDYCSEKVGLHLANERIRLDILRLNSIIKKWDIDGFCYSANDLAREFRQTRNHSRLSLYMTKQIKLLYNEGRVRTAETYTAAMRSFTHFLSEKDLNFESDIHGDIPIYYFTAGLVNRYQSWLRRRGITLNTVSFYIRILRAVYNRAVEEFSIESNTPFRRAYTGVAKTRKRALSLSAMSTIKNLDLSDSPQLDFARDMFMLSFYLRGMSFVDMAFLKKTNLRDNYISYCRRKTGKQLTIYWTKEMQEILNKYPQNASQYLLPIITLNSNTSNTNDRKAYLQASARINRLLKKIASLIGLTFPLTMYVARHSWASVAKSQGIPTGIISEGMGHDSETTTQIYLASLDANVVDRANSIIISSL